MSDTAAALLVLLAVVLYAGRPQNFMQFANILTVRVSLKNALLVGGFVIFWPLALTIAGAYRNVTGSTLRTVVGPVVSGVTLGSVLVLPVLLASRTGLFGLFTVPIFWIGAIIGTLLIRLGTCTGAALSRVRSRPRRLVIAGTGMRAAAVWEELRRHPFIRYELIATTDRPGVDMALAFADKPMIAVNDLEAFCMHTVIDELVVALPIRSCYLEIERVLETCERAGVHSLYLADAFSPTIARTQITNSGGFSAVALRVAHDDWRIYAKRTLDVVVASVLLILLSPVFLAIAIAVKLTSPGPALFAQERYGFRKRRFRMHKFRTMVVGAERLQATLETANEASGPVFKIRRDPRVTPVGRFLRRTSLDELPQLWNVVVGDMSLVGPRPLAVRDVKRFDESWLMRRFSVPPGITCLWQISGRSNLSFDEWMRLDLEYIDNWSLRLDAQILLWTIPAVLTATGAA